MQIEVSEDSLRTYSEQMIGYIQEFESYVQQISSIIDSVSTFWSGDDAEKFTVTFREAILDKLNTLDKVLTDYGQFLADAGNAYDELDNVYSSKSIDF